MTSRLDKFLKKRKSSYQPAEQNGQRLSTGPPSPQPSTHSVANSNSTPPIGQNPHNPSTSTTSVPTINSQMSGSPGQGQQRSSYPYQPPPHQGPLGPAPQNGGRASPMPPRLQTNPHPYGPPPQQMGQYDTPPPQYAPPQGHYQGPFQQPPPQQYPAALPPVEVPGSQAHPPPNKNKAQLIVGIDFVGQPHRSNMQIHWLIEVFRELLSPASHSHSQRTQRQRKM